MGIEIFIPYMKRKSFRDRLRWFGNTASKIEQLYYSREQGRRNGQDKETMDWYDREIEGQTQRLEFLYQNLNESYEQLEREKTLWKKRALALERLSR